MKRGLFLLLAVVLVAGVCQADVITWTGASNTDFFNEANWTQQSTGNPPAAGTVNSGVIIPFEVVIGAGANVVAAQSTQISLGDGGIMSVTDATIGGDFNTRYSPNPNLSAGSQTITLNGSTSLTYGWAWYTDWVVNDDVSLIATNSNGNADGGALGKTSTLNLVGAGSSFELTQVPLANATTSAWLAKIKVNGADADLGVNLFAAASNDGKGTLFTVPEPATIGLLAFGGLAVIRRRRCA